MHVWFIQEFLFCNSLGRAFFRLPYSFWLDQFSSHNKRRGVLHLLLVLIRWHLHMPTYKHRWPVNKTPRDWDVSRWGDLKNHLRHGCSIIIPILSRSRSALSHPQWNQYHEVFQQKIDSHIFSCLCHITPIYNTSPFLKKWSIRTPHTEDWWNWWFFFRSNKNLFRQPSILKCTIPFPWALPCIHWPSKTPLSKKRVPWPSRLEPLHCPVYVGPFSTCLKTRWIQRWMMDGVL